MDNNELRHYGVPGMKWGVRKSREVYTRKLERDRKKKKRDYIEEQAKNILNSKDPGAIRKTRSKYKDNDTELMYRIAKQKAKLDPAYKNSEEYKNARIAYGKVKAKKAIQRLMNTINRPTH
jgi:hypothetical protein